MIANINLPRIFRVGAGASAEAVNCLAPLAIQRPLLVTDEFIAQQPFTQALIDSLSAADIEFSVFAYCVPDPTTESVAAALQALESGGCDGLIAIGGGSSMDTAKAVAVMASRQGALRNYKVPAQLDSGLAIIAIPTTAGTGSEVTRVAVVTDTDSDEKMLLMGLGLMPQAALVDYELSMAMPFRLSADTGIDSLCHAMEAYVSRKSNSFTDGLALTAMRLIFANLRSACFEPNNRPAREAMMLAASQAGMAFANSSVTLIHGMSRPVGAHYHVPHGMSNAMLMVEVTAWSVASAPQRYADCARAMGLAAADDSTEDALTLLVQGLRDLVEVLEVPTPQAYGIDKTQWLASLPVMAQQALDSGSPANNPRIADAEQIMALYRAAYNR